MPDFKFDVKELEAIHENSKDVGLLWKTFGDMETLAAGLNTSLKDGLSQEEINAKFEERRKKYGINSMPPPPLRSFWDLVFEGLQDSTLIMLMIAAVISLTLGLWENPEHGWIEGTAILIAVFLVVMVASGNDYQKERQFRKLNEKKDNKQIKVMRGGEQTEVSIYDINVGDIVIIATGDVLAADGVLIEGHNVQCDNSTLTGESKEVKINHENPLLFAGCLVSEGIGKMLVISVGPHSTSGKLMSLLQGGGREETPLQEKLETLANDQIARIGLAAAALILFCLIVKLIFKIYWYDMPITWHIFSEIVKYFITSVTIVVVAVPEGLPLAVTIALAYSMLQMVKDQNLVRQLDACETMGGATTICSDKTGTLTKNQMTVTKGWIGGSIFESVDKVPELSSTVSRALHEGININCTAYEGRNQRNEIDFIGNKTECALLTFSKKLGANYKQVKDSLIVDTLFPFSSTVKSMSTVVKTDNGYRLYSKGASEIMLTRCNQYMDPSGKIHPIDETVEKQLEDSIVYLASDGLRTILLAYRDFTTAEYKTINWEEVPPQDKYVCIAISGIKDPLRDEVKDAVKACQKAGIVVRMVTGDNILTAKKIAEEAGILTKGGLAIEGPDFRKLSEKEMDEIIPKLQVMARSSPTDKYILVTRLKALGEVVAVTGDGTNDAPALKQAHVGFSMGITGTEVAKEASDIILMDDNFSSIVKAVMWGRNVYDSIRKFLQFQLTVNVVAVSLAFIGAITNEHGESPLKPVQLLWVNLIMDTMAALALATDVPTPDLLERKPYGKNDNLITKSMWYHIFGQAAFQLVVNLFILYFGHIIFDVPYDGVTHRTIIFNIFVLCQIFNEINCRKLGSDPRIFDGFFTNQICVAILIFTLITQYLMVEYGGEFASTTPLSLGQWIISFLIGALSIPVSLAIRKIPVKEDQIPSFLEPENKELGEREKLGVSANKGKWKAIRNQAVMINAATTLSTLSAEKKKPTTIESFRRRRVIETGGL